MKLLLPIIATLALSACQDNAAQYPMPQTDASAPVQQQQGGLDSSHLLAGAAGVGAGMLLSGAMNKPKQTNTVIVQRVYVAPRNTYSRPVYRSSSYSRSSFRSSRR